MKQEAALLLGETNPGGLTGSYARGFADLGVNVEVFDYYACIEEGLPKGLRPHLLRSMGWSLNRPRAERRLVERVATMRPGLVFAIKCDDLTAEVYSAIRVASPGTTLAAFHPDDPFNRRRLLRRGPSHRRALVQIRSVDCFFVWAPHLVERARQAGARRARYLAFGLDPHLHFPIDLSPADRRRFGADVAFIGNWDEKRQQWLSAFERSGLQLAIWGGTYWRDRCRSDYLRKSWRGTDVVGDDFRRAVAGAKVCLNVLRTQNEGGHNMRTFEIPGCGGVLLAEWSDDQARHLRPDREAVYVPTPGEMVAAAARLCEDGGAREAIRRAGRARAQTATYAHRAREVLATSLESPTAPTSRRP